MNLKDIKLNTKETKTSNAGGQAAHETLLEALSNSKGYSMRTVDAIEVLYAGDDRSEDKIKNSFASVKSHCFSKADWRVEFTDSARENIAIVGKRAEGEAGRKGEWNPIA